MASRIIHLTVAKLVIGKINIIDENVFYLGNLAPDLARYGMGDYNKSHFGTELSEIKRIDYSQFVEKYRDKIITDDFVKGYFVHLLTDAIWLKDIQQEFIRKNHGIKTELYKLGYEDMKIYNSLLIEKFKIRKIEAVEIKSIIEEVETTYFDELLNDLESDFVTDTYNLELLQVYPYEAVINFILESVDRCVKNLKNIDANEKVDKSINYYVPIVGNVVV